MFGLTAAAVASYLIFHFTREPRFHGRGLSAWADDLRSGEPAVRSRAMRVFRESPDAVNYLGRRIGSAPGPVQRASEFMGRYVPEWLKKPLRRLYDPGRRLLDKHLAAQALQQLGTNAAPAIPTLARMLHDPNVLLSGSAGVTLGRIGPAAVPVLVEALDDPDFNVRASALTALAQQSTNAAPAIPRLAAMVEGESGPIVTLAAHALSQVHEPAIPTLIQLLASTNATARRWAAFGLGQMGYIASESLPALTNAVRDPEEQVRWAAIDAVGRVSYGSQGADVLLQSLEDADPVMRGLAMTGLANRFGLVRRHMKRIELLLQDESPMVRSNAAVALGRSGSFASNALPALKALAKDPDAAVRTTAQEACEQIERALRLR